MPYISTDGDFERVFMTSSEFIDRFTQGNLYRWGGGTSIPAEVSGAGFGWNSVSGYSGGTDDLGAAIKTDGTLWTWNASGSPISVVGGGNNWKQVSAGESHYAAIKTDGTLWTWGVNGFGQLGDGTTTSRSSPGTTAGGGTNWKQVFAGTRWVAAIKTDGTLWTWGFDAYGVQGTAGGGNRSSPGTTVVGGNDWKQVSGGRYAIAALKTDGSVWTWGGSGWLQFGGLSGGTPTVNSTFGTNYKQVSCSYRAVSLIKTDGTLWSWGRWEGVGDGTTTNRASPVTTAGGGTNWKYVNQGGYSDPHVRAIKTDGTLWTWGNNAFAQLGDGTTTDRSSPIQPINNLSNWITVGGNYTTSFGTAKI